MLELLKELLCREWEFSFHKPDETGEYYFYMVLGNGERVAYTEKDALEILEEIRTYW